ncbi:MAG: xanthine dehydrogenase family protein molybdopterin-binding subunit [Chloroflexota bacterium]|nr:xanthine dehydrogenase family protein molybdopterin-binding subunit [Chloroflexota bacterium]MDE2961657.1 xanthine dehydrogenase family protein molybdopterin-binding subunit [Chloroflexota bacterium]
MTTQFKVLERNHPRVDAYDKVTGRAAYASDVYLPGMLACKLLPSTRNHARIVRLDTSKAESHPGVRCVVTGTDFPNIRYGSGALRDRYVMPREVVNFVGEPIAAVAADDEATAQEAIELIEVEYEDMPAVVNPLSAMGTDAATVHPELEEYEGYGFTLGHNVSTLLDADRGDVDQAFRDADVVVEDVYRSQGINQGFLEPMACVADVEANGRLVVYASTQGPYQIRAALAGALEIPVSRIRVVPMELGGGFGAKLRLAFEAFPALLAMKTGRPVKLVNTREEVFTMNGPRLPVTNYIRSGVMHDGTIVAREAYTIFDVGAYLGAGPNSGIGHGIGAYNVPNFRLRSYGVYTNKIYVGSYRASGVADMTFAVESHMDRIAHEIGMDPYDLRVKNALREGDVSVSGAVVPTNGLMETLEAIKEKIGWPRDLEDGHGVGLALCEWRSGSGPSTASISVNDDGTVSLLTGSVDISGSDTSLAAIAAEALGIPMDKVIVAKRDTDLAPYTGQSGGSRIVYSQGTAVQRAAEDTVQKLTALAAERLGVPEDALGCEDGRIYVMDNEPQGLTFAQLAAASITSRGGPIIGTAALSSMPYTPVFAAQAAEVKVDRQTGQVKLLRYIQAQDVGTAINPMAVEGQLDGGVVQGIGRALTEDQQFDPETGAVRNPSLASYLMPLAIDLPELENVLINVPAPDGPFGARAVAEPPGFGPPAAIANAVYDAVGVRVKELPLSGERVLAALNGQNADIDFDVDALRRAEGLAAD